MSRGRNNDADFKEFVANEARKGEGSVSEFVAAYGVRPAKIHLWK